MSLTKLFNFHYMYENIKKSKMPILLCVLVVPFLTTIMLLTADVEAFSFASLGIFNILLMYVIPFILSANLFGYIYKKSSVDFMGSMPLSRKTIFFTNTLAGILLILAMQGLTLFCTLMISTFSDSIIMAGLAWDVFVYQTFAYIFLFTIANLAMSVAGNMMTQIVGILLITFLMPALYTFTFMASDPYITTDTFDHSTFSPILHFGTFTAPSLIVSGSYGFNVTSMVKMIALSIIYIAFGFVFFQRRKMEKAGESFVKKSTHYLVKGLTLLPFVMIIKIVFISEEFEALPFVLGITLIYWLVYDLITSKKMKFWPNMAWLGGSILTIFAVLSGLIGIQKSIWNSNVNIENITKLELSKTYYDNGAYDTSEKYIIQDQDLILSIISNSKNYSYEKDDSSTNMYGIAYFKGGRKYHVSVQVDNSDLSKVMEHTVKQRDIPSNKNIKIYLDSKIASRTEKKELSELLKNMEPRYIRVSNGFDSYVRYDMISSFGMYRNGFYRTVSAYEYINHKMYLYEYSEEDSKELEAFLTKLHNQTAYEQAKVTRAIDIYYGVRDGNHNYKTSSSSDVKANLKQFIIDNQGEKVDLNQDYIRISLDFRNVGKQVSVSYTTNKVSEVIEKFTVSGEEIEDWYYYDDFYPYEEIPATEVKTEVLEEKEELQSEVEEEAEEVYTSGEVV